MKLGEYFFVVDFLVEGVIEIEDGFLEELGQVHLLSVSVSTYLYSLTITVSLLFTVTMSCSPLDNYFLDRGRLRIATSILGCYI